MSEETNDTAYLIDHHGQVVAAPLARAASMLGLGYTPAGDKQIEDFKKQEAFHAKYGTTGQQIATGAEAAGSAATFGLSPLIERGLGVPAEDIRARKEENPLSHMAGTAIGVAAPLIASGGTSALGEAADLTAPALISKLGEGAEGLVEGMLPEATTAAGRVLTKAVTSAASGLTEGAAWGAGQVVDEASMGDPNLTASHALEEVGLSALLGGGISGATGVLGGLIGQGVNKYGGQIDDWLNQFEARNNLGQTSGGQNIKGQLAKDIKNQGWKNVNQMARDGRDMGLGAPLSSAQANFDLAGELKSAAGDTMEATKSAVDNSAEGVAAMPAAAKVAAQARNDILASLKENFAETGVANHFENIVNEFENKFKAQDVEQKMSFSQMHDARQMLDKAIYGIRGDATVSTTYKEALHDFRDMISKEISTGLEKVPGDAAKDWAAANRQYQIASFFQKYAEKGLLGQKGNNLFPLSTWIPALAGLLHGGPLGAALVGGAGFLAKRYGPGALAEGARFARKLVDEEAATGLASKTAEAIASAREGALEVGGATRAGMLWSRLGSTLERPVMAPGKDLMRDVAQEHVGGGAEGTPMESVAALSQLQAANMRAEKKIAGLAKALASGSAVGGTTKAIGAEEMAKVLDRAHMLATNQEALLAHVTQQSKDIQEHAPNTARAISTVSSRAVNHLHLTFPAPAKLGPLGPIPKTTKHDLWKQNRILDVTVKPTHLLRHAANGTLIPEQVQAVAAVHPEHLNQMRRAVLEEMTGAEKVPHKSLMMASILLGQPMHASMTPQAIMANQAVFNRPSKKSGQDQMNPMTGKSTQTGLAKLNVAGHSMLPGRAVESRRGEA